MGSDSWHRAMAPIFGEAATELPSPKDPSNIDEVEACYWETLLRIREIVSGEQALCENLASRVQDSLQRLDRASREPRSVTPSVDAVIEACRSPETPSELQLEIASKFPLRKQLGQVLGFLNQ